jgi:hypothetical protein
MYISQIWSFATFTSLVLLNNVCATVYTVPNAAYIDSSVAEYTSLASELDGQKITPWPNETSYEWFDTAHLLM